MMMKRLLCVVLCMMLVIPAAAAETADTLPKLFIRQLSGGSGARGYISVTASGVAEWLNMLLPFTAADIQMRAIAQKQGDLSESVSDDDEWQVKLFVKDAADAEAGVTMLYGDQKGVYMQSELLPDAVLGVPVDQFHLLYQLFKGEFSDMFFAFDPMELLQPGENGNVSAYQAIAEMLNISESDWTDRWLPVLEKYFLHLDLWLAGYGESSVVNQESGFMTMSASYQIPAEDLKDEAKYIIGQMMYDNDLQSLLISLVTMEQRITYLNPQMLYFYEACIDALDISGNIVLAREMSAMGEVVGTRIELPMPALPAKLIAPIENGIEKIFGVGQVLQGMNRLIMTEGEDGSSVVISGEEYSVQITSRQMDDKSAREGMIQILPVDAAKKAITARFNCKTEQRIWQDEKYLDHDTTEFAFAIESNNEMVSAEAAEKYNFAEFAPMGLQFELDYRNNPHQQNRPVQVNLEAAIQMPDASVSVEAVLRITTQIVMEELRADHFEDVNVMSEERKMELLDSFINNAVAVMTGLYEAPAEQTAPEGEAVPTTVPPVSE